MLKYAGPSPDKLLFTTSLRNSIQSYSLAQSKMLDPSDSHPSPPTVFALSCTSHLLLSTSNSPPTIYLRQLEQHVPPTLLRPRCSASQVTAATFHPDSADLFVLAFADGSAAVYDASLILHDLNNSQQESVPAGSSSDGEMGFIKGLHAVNSRSRKYSVNDDRNRCMDHNRTSIEAESSAITAVALVSGRRMTAITVGADGKCCVVNFTQSIKRKAQILNTWYLRHPVTCLSVVCSESCSHLLELDGAAEQTKPANTDYCIAAGRQDGKVLLFDLDGKALGKQKLDAKGGPIIDVQWAKNGSRSAFTPNSLSMPESGGTVPASMSVGIEDEGVQRRENRPLTVRSEHSEQSENGLRHIPLHPYLTPEFATGAMNYLDLTHAKGSEVRTHIGRPNSSTEPSSLAETSITSTGSTNSMSIMIDFGASPPPVPPRPVPKLGGRLSERRVMIARQSPTRLGDTQSIKPVNDRRDNLNNTSPTKPTFPIAAFVKQKTFGLRSPQRSPAKSWILGPRPQPNYVTQSAVFDVPSDLKRGGLPINDPPDTLSDVDNRIGHPLPLVKADTVSPSPPKLPKRLNVDASMASFRSYKTASSQPDSSEISSDTVVDWSTASASHRLEPSIREPSLIPLTPRPSPLRNRPLTTLPDDRKIQMQGRWHESIDASTQTSPYSYSFSSQASQDNVVANPIEHRPTIKKSPRVADISAGVVSITASLLDSGGYTDPTILEQALHEDETLPNGQKHQESSSPSSVTSKKKTRFIPPRLPLKISPGTANLRDDNVAHTCPCESNFQAMVSSSLDLFRLEIERGLTAQQRWIEQFIKEGRKPAG